MAKILFEDLDLGDLDPGVTFVFQFPSVDVRDEQGHRIHRVEYEKVSKKVREELQKAIDAYVGSGQQAINQAQSRTKSRHLKSSPLKGAESRDSPKPPGQKRKEAGEAASESAGPRRSKQSKSDRRSDIGSRPV